MNETFGKQAAARYEDWYETAAGARADRLEKAALQRLLDTLSEVRSVLEIGCGTGHFTRWLAAAGWTAVGLDLSVPMLAEARALNGVPLTQGDAHRLPFADGAFDVTTLITTLEFLERPAAALAEASRVARRGMVLGVLNRCSILGLRRRLEGLLRSTVYDKAQFYSVDDLKRLTDAAVDDVGRIEWVTTLFPSWWPWPRARLPWGGFIAMAVGLARGEETDPATNPLTGRYEG